MPITGKKTKIGPKFRNHIVVCIEENRISTSFCIWHSKEYIFLHGIHFYGQSFFNLKAELREFWESKINP